MNRSELNRIRAKAANLSGGAVSHAGSANTGMDLAKAPVTPASPKPGTDFLVNKNLSAAPKPPVTPPVQPQSAEPAQPAGGGGLLEGLGGMLAPKNVGQLLSLPGVGTAIQNMVGQMGPAGLMGVLGMNDALQGRTDRIDTLKGGFGKTSAFSPPLLHRFAKKANWSLADLPGKAVGAVNDAWNRTPLLKHIPDALRPTLGGAAAGAGLGAIKNLATGDKDDDIWDDVLTGGTLGAAGGGLYSLGNYLSSKEAPPPAPKDPEGQNVDRLLNSPGNSPAEDRVRTRQAWLQEHHPDEAIRNSALKYKQKWEQEPFNDPKDWVEKLEVMKSHSPNQQAVTEATKDLKPWHTGADVARDLVSNPLLAILPTSASAKTPALAEVIDKAIRTQTDPWGNRVGPQAILDMYKKYQSLPGVADAYRDYWQARLNANVNQFDEPLSAEQRPEIEELIREIPKAPASQFSNVPPALRGSSW